MVKTPVEQALAEAIRDPGARPEFYRLLLESDVYAVTANSPCSGRSTSGSAGQRCRLLEEDHHFGELATQTDSPPGARVLLVDDEPAVLRDLSRLLVSAAG